MNWYIQNRYTFSNPFFSQTLLPRNNLDHDGATSVQEFLLMARKASQMVEEANQITAEVKPGGYLWRMMEERYGWHENLNRCGNGGFLVSINTK